MIKYITKELKIIERREINDDVLHAFNMSQT